MGTRLRKARGSTALSSHGLKTRPTALKRLAAAWMSLVLLLSQALGLATPTVTLASTTGDRVTLQSATPIYDGSHTYEFWLSDGSIAWCGDVNLNNPDPGSAGSVMDGSAATWHRTYAEGRGEVAYTASQLHAIDYLVYQGVSQISSSGSAFGMYGRWGTGCLKASAVVQIAIWMVRFYPEFPDVTIDGNWGFYAGDGTGHTSDIFWQDCVRQAYAEAKAYADAGGGNPAIDGCAHVIKWDNGGQDIFFYASPAGSVKLKKTSSDNAVAGNGAYSLEGAVYNVYADASCTVGVGSLTTNAQGETNELTVAAGTYYAKEAQASPGYELCGDVHRVDVTAGGVGTFECAEKPAKGRVGLKKTSNAAVDGNPSYSLAGARYEVFSDEKLTSKVGELVTDTTGNTAELEVYAGTYYAREVETSAGHDLCRETHKVNVAPGAVATFNCTEPATTSPLTLRKASKGETIDGGNSNYSLAGAKYNVYADAGLTSFVCTLTTDKDGSSNTVELLAGTYYVKETQPSPGHAICEQIHTVTVTLGQAAEIRCEEPVIYGSARIKKSSAGEKIDPANSNYSLAGAVYGVYRDEDCHDLVTTLATDEDGNTPEATLLADVYYVKETKASKGHELCDEIHKVTVEVNRCAEVRCEEPVRYAWAKLKKTSANKSLTAGNACYSLAGATYDVFSDAACTTKVGTLTTDKIGESNTLRLLAGIYYARETRASEGYRLCGETHAIILNCGETGTFTCEETPAADPIELLLAKFDAEKGFSEEGNSPLGAATLEGAEFTVDYYDTLAYADAAALKKSGAKPARSWVFKTDSAGTVTLDENHLVSGDALYHDLNGSACLPRGTVVIRESKAPEGYIASEQVFFQKIQESVTAADVVTYNTPKVAEQVKRGDIEFSKRADNGSARMAGVPFKVTSVTTGESHVIVTDENGCFASTSSMNGHASNTNANDWALEVEGSIDSGKLDLTAGTWFGEGTSANDELGAFPYDTYTLEELRASANSGYALVATEFTVSRDRLTIDLGTLDDPEPEIRTCARDAADGDKYLAVGNATIVDSVSYSHLVKDREYTLKAQLVDAKTSAAITDESGNAVCGQTTFTAEKSHGKTEVSLTLPTFAYMGRTLVVYEQLYDAGGELLAEHADIDDADQQVTVAEPQISTMATDGADGDKDVTADPEARVVDTVSYSGLAAGENYTLTGVLMEKVTDEAGNATAKEFMSNGQHVVSKADFTTESSEGTAQVVFDFDTSELTEGTQLVVFEELTWGDHTLASHADAEDEGQTVRITRPTIATNAVDAADKDQNVVAEPEAHIIDTVRYSGVVPGKTYKVHGTLMEKIVDAQGNIEAKELLDADGKAITAEAEFIPDSNEGQVEVEFVFDATALGNNGRTELVVFESLLRGNRELATHADINDKNQTVLVTPPSIRTTAVDAFDDDKNVIAEPEVSVRDTVCYDNVTPGKTYTLAGTLMDASTGKALTDADGNPICSTTEFLAEKSSGEAEVIFNFDASAIADNTKLVVFEALSYNGTEIASHADLSDAGQTVTVTKPLIKTLATDGLDADKNLIGEADAVVVDTVIYENVTPGKTYRISGTLYDKTTGQAIMGADDQPVTAAEEFTPADTNGTVDVTFTFDASAYLAGENLVAFEKLSYKGIEVATHADIDDESQTVNVTKPSLSTRAVDAADGDKNIVAEGDVSVVDTVRYSNVSPGKTYKVTGKLMEKVADADGHAQGKVFIDANGQEITASAEFTPEETCGEICMTFNFDASGIAEGTELVVFETLSYKEAELTSHADINDEAQTTTVISPAIETTATDGLDDDKVVAADESATVVDTVRYENLTPGKTYQVSGVLMEKVTGEDGSITSNELLVDGEKVTASAEFIPESPCGEVQLTFAFDASTIADETPLVAFETLIYKDKEIAVHADIEDEDQTVVVHTPKIKTFAFDGLDNDKELVADAEATIRDQVIHTNLIPGETYTLAGLLIDTKNGLPVLTGNADEVTDAELETFSKALLTALGIEQAEDKSFNWNVSSALPTNAAADALANLAKDYPNVVSRLVWSTDTFTAENNSDYRIINFDFNATQLVDPLTGTAKDVVVFEALFKGKLTFDKTPEIEDTTARLIAAEFDSDCDEQTVRIKPSTISTQAADKADGDHEVLATDSASITDTVSYQGLVPGKEYTLHATLMDKSTGAPLEIAGRTITADLRIIPKAQDGEITIDLGPFDASALANHTLVVFEELSRNVVIDGTETTVPAAEHKDINDEGQSVYVTPVPNNTPSTGDATTWAAFALASFSGLTAVGVSRSMQKKTARREKVSK